MGTDPLLDQAINAMPGIDGFLQQRSDESCSLEEAIGQMMKLPL